jgi:hypothetical protein
MSDVGLAGRTRGKPAPAPAPPATPSPPGSVAKGQEQLGNAAVGRSLTGRRPAPQRPGAAANSAAVLQDLQLEALFEVYALRAPFIVVVGRTSSSMYTKEWVEGPGQPALLAAIEGKLDAEVAAGHRNRLLELRSYVSAMDAAMLKRLLLTALIDARIPTVRRPDDPFAGRFLEKETRNDLELNARGRVDRAFTAFVSAIKDHKDALAAAARAQAELAAMVIDVFTGFLAPGVGRALGRLANALPLKTTSSYAYLKALDLLDNPDITRATFTGVTKAVSSTLKINAKALFGEGEVDQFLTWLEVEQQRIVQGLAERTPFLSDLELLVLNLVYEADVANVVVYRKVIGDIVTRFQREVEPIGQVTFHGGEWGGSTSTDVYWVEKDGKKRLALLNYVSAGFYGAFWFVRWISPEMHALALQKGLAANKRGIETVPLSKVRAPGGTIPPPSPNW